MIEIDLSSNLNAVLQQLQEKARELNNLSPLMRRVAGIMADAVEENFERQGRPRWKPLKESTIRQREKEGYWPGKILQRTGRLASSIESRYGKTEASVQVGGSQFPYAAIHQFGGKAGPGRKVEIPARPYLTLSDDDLKEIEEEFRIYLKEI